MPGISVAKTEVETLGEARYNTSTVTGFAPKGQSVPVMGLAVESGIHLTGLGSSSSVQGRTDGPMNKCLGDGTCLMVIRSGPPQRLGSERSPLRCSPLAAWGRSPIIRVATSRVLGGVHIANRVSGARRNRGLGGEPHRQPRFRYPQEPRVQEVLHSTNRVSG